MVGLGVCSNLVLQFESWWSTLVVVSFCIISAVHIALIFQRGRGCGCHGEVNGAGEGLGLRGWGIAGIC